MKNKWIFNKFYIHKSKAKKTSFDLKKYNFFLIEMIKSLHAMQTVKIFI